MSQSKNTQRMTGWALLGLLLCLVVSYAVSRKYQALLLLPVFLPLMTAVVAHRYGKRVFTVLTVLAIPGMLWLGWNLTERMSISFEIPVSIFLLSAGTAIAFCRPAVQMSQAELINDRFRWTRWLMLAALWLMLHHYAIVEFELLDDVDLETNIGAIALMILLALSINWRNFAAAFRELVLTSERRWANGLRTTIWVLLAVSVLLNVRWNFDYVFSGGFGFTDSTGFLLVAVFGLSALGKVDWRIAMIAVAVIVVSEDLTRPLYDWIETLMAEDVPAIESDVSATDGPGLERIVVTGSPIGPSGFVFGHSVWFSLVSTLCVALLGTAVAPAWRSKSPEALETRRTSIYMVSAVFVAFVAVPLDLMRFDYVQYLVLLAAGLLMGYRYRYRAVVLAPLVLVFAFLSIGFAFARSYGDIPSAFRAIDICFVAFPATFIGILLRRYRLTTSGTGTAHEVSNS